MDVNNLIQLHLSQPTNFSIFPQLASTVSKSEWDTLEKVGISPSNYTTHDILEINSLNKNSFPLNKLLVVDIPEKLIQQDDSFYSYAEVMQIPKESIKCLKKALEVLESVEGLYPTILILVKNLHILRSESNDVDISYSLPNIPFSIFVSLPVTRQSNDYLRVAEGVLHETMHLQLSLIEKIKPLVKNGNDKFYSPWKGEQRNIQGILHALYVFRVIRKFYQLLTTTEQIPDFQFCIKRTNEIENEINLFRNLGKLDCLTNSGNEFIQHLISY